MHIVHQSSVCPSYPIPAIPLSEELTGVYDVCETVRKLPINPQPLCGSHQMVFAVNLEPILIFNHLLQRLYPNSLKGEGCKGGLSER